MQDVHILVYVYVRMDFLCQPDKRMTQQMLHATHPRPLDFASSPPPQPWRCCHLPTFFLLQFAKI